MELNKIYLGDCVNVLKAFPDESIDCCVTSPPYFGLRDYGIDGQIGQEDSPEQYVNKLINVFQEVHRVLKKDGTLWLNIGDSWAGSCQGSGTQKQGEKQKTNRGTNYTADGKYKSKLAKLDGYKPKDLIGIPWLVAFALRECGWYLRQDIIWSKPNPMPESVKDRCTKPHEYIFLFSKSRKYYFDALAIAEPVSNTTVKRLSQDVCNQKGSQYPGKTNGNMKAVSSKWGGLRNKRDVWFVATKPCREAHFATFPDTLIEPCILAGCPENGIVLDPFMGAGTTAIVSKRNNRNYIGIELNPEYISIAERRINQ